MFTNTVQPNIISLFSSTSSEPLSLFSQQTDRSLTADSFIHFLNDASSLPSPSPPAVLCSMPALDDNDEPNIGYSLHQTVLHIQSPTLRMTFIRSPPNTDPGDRDLGLKQKWLHLQVRNVGREWSFEIGIVDKCVTFMISPVLRYQPSMQTLKEPKLTISPVLNAQPVLHLPLSFPQPSSRPLTAWSTITLSLPSLIPHFGTLASMNQPDDGEGSRHDTNRSATFSATNITVPSGTYSHLSYIKIYATCRLRRIWLSDLLPDSQVPWEFELYGA
ncbi:uncharacterized protein BJ212DRAFT_1444549 [Suillus subaureus]|uniref:CFA20 domain-containing protein n=1 Tax=Suillus subaureus TaxID=48587 RepID=A0A9P7JHV8_9AGAM|nr:uncharacterized protein BJ212DRAFT_1444549 [Suillus subaureus]KAG1823364.1 hypothetical protein BJ212DRAFT_1444549 [Suillus subaureus]